VKKPVRPCPIRLSVSGTSSRLDATFGSGGGLQFSPVNPKEHWKSSPDDHDYPAAHDYLSLCFSEAHSAKLVEALKAAPITHRKAKDLLRASALEPLPDTNVHVAKDLQKVHAGQQLSPVLVVRGDALRDAPLVIADGYHRICASHVLDEDADIPCRLVDRPAPGS
jgi:hypothetical protein